MEDTFPDERPPDPRFRWGIRIALILGVAAAIALEFRRENNGLFIERLASRTVYYKAYEPFELDQYAELERLRQAGVRTSSVPPSFDQLNR